jgi:hypothetical protein
MLGNMLSPVEASETCRREPKCSTALAGLLVAALPFAFLAGQATISAHTRLMPLSRGGNCADSPYALLGVTLNASVAKEGN